MQKLFCFDSEESFKLFKEIEVYSHRYKTGGNLYLLLIDFRSRKINESTSMLIQRANIPARTIMGPQDNYHLRIPAEYFRPLVDFLHSHDYISNDDRASIEDLVRKVEKNLKLQTSKDVISISQKDILNDLFFEVYFPDILACSSTIEIAISILKKACCSEYGMSPSANKLFSSLLHNEITQAALNSEQQKSLLSALAIISKLFSGNADLESAFKQTGDSIPSLKMQRTVMFESYKVELIKKFGCLENSFGAILMLNTLISGIPIKLLSFTDHSDITKTFKRLDWLLQKEHICDKEFIEIIKKSVVDLKLPIDKIVDINQLSNAQQQLIRTHILVENQGADKPILGLGSVRN